MHDAGPSNSPSSARLFAVTDAQLSAELKKWTGATPALHPVGELLDRHWEAGFAYARLCAADARTAGMLTTAAFTRLFGETLRQTGPTAAWRPQLLVTVRRIAAEWDTDHRREQLHPELRSAWDGGENAAADLLPPAHRRLLSEAFQRLPQSARCLLWHTEVEAEPLAIPGGLLGLDEEDARVELGRSRERFREECLHVHRELAPEQECRQYQRMLDVTYRRGGIDIDPDLRAHLDRCGHCRDTAEQLNQFNSGLGAALAEAVLGWGAGAYLEARARRAGQPAEAAPTIEGESFFGPEAPSAPAGKRSAARRSAARVGESAAPPADVFAAASAAFAPADAFAPAGEPAPPAGEPFTAGAEPLTSVPRPRSASRSSRRAATGARTADSAASGTPAAGSRSTSSRSALKAARRARRRNLTAAVATVGGLIVLPLVLWSSLGSGDSSSPSASADDHPSETPGPTTGKSTTNPSWAGAEEAAKGTLRGRLHNIESGLCVGIAGPKLVKGAEAELATCSSADDQQWSYETDGLLRSVTDPDLCLDSHLGYSVRLAPCGGASDSAAKNVRYDFTLQGTLVPRFDQDLALTPAATDGSGALVLKTREDSEDVQHWVIDTSQTELQMEVVNWDADSGALTDTSPAPTPKTARKPSPTPTPSATPPTAEPAPTGTHPTNDDCSSHPYACSWGDQDGGSGHGYGGYGYGGDGGYGGYGGYGYGGGRT